MFKKLMSLVFIMGCLSACAGKKPTEVIKIEPRGQCDLCYTHACQIITHDDKTVECIYE